MTFPRTPRADPVGNARLRPGDERAALAGAQRTTRRIALAALALAVLGVGLAAWRYLAPADTGCQQAAWNTTPAVGDLPPGWTIGASQFDLGRRQMTLLGPVPQDETSTRAVLYATITCYPQGAADSVTRSSDAAKAAGQTVTARSDLGDQGFLAEDASGAFFLQFRHAGIVVYLAASGDAKIGDLEEVASAFDRSLGGDGGAAAIGTPDAGSPAPTDDLLSPSASDEPPPSESPAAPELESVLPRKVGTIDLKVESSLGTTILSDDQGSRAIVAALRAAGRTPADLRVAQAYDVTATADLSLLAISVKGMKRDALKALALDAWLAATGAGVKLDTATLAGVEFTRVDYGDGGAKDYVLAEADLVIIIETADAALAEQAAAALP